MNAPSPHEYETKPDYLDRVESNAAMVKTHPLPFKRRAAGEQRWAQAKRESLVSIKTSVTEVLLFGSL